MFAAVGGSSCLMLGAAVAIKALNDFDDDNNTLSFDEGVRLTMADTDDSMTLEQALDAAREQTGSEGVFVHQGIAYATVSEKEWSRLPEPEKDTFRALQAPADDNDESDIIIVDRVVPDEGGRHAETSKPLNFYICYCILKIFMFKYS